MWTNKSDCDQLIKHLHDNNINSAHDALKYFSFWSSVKYKIEKTCIAWYVHVFDFSK